MFSCVTIGLRIPADHPMRRILAMVDRALSRMHAVFHQLYSEKGRPLLPRSVFRGRSC